MAASEEYAAGLDKKYGSEGFVLNVHAPADWKSGAYARDSVGTVTLSEQK